MNNEQSREYDNAGYTGRRKTKHNTICVEHYKNRKQDMIPPSMLALTYVT